MLSRFRAYGITTKIHPLQGGFRPGYSCLHTAFIFQETIAHLREQKKKVYVALLDVKKAFDTVWHGGLFHKIQEAGISGQALNFIRQWYDNSTCSVLWNGQPSRTISISQGVKQGGVLSPLLYSLYVNDLLVELENSGLGARLGNIYSGAPMYADDLALIATSPEELQGMLDIVQTYAQKWRYSLHPGKTKIMVFGCRHPPPSRWKLGSDTIEVVDQHLHLGIFHSSKGTIARTILQTSRGRSSFFALNHFGTKFGCTHPLTALRLYQAICLPRMLYGAPLWNISNTEMELYERVHRKILRTIQGLPIRCPKVGVLWMAGAKNIKDIVLKEKLTFLQSILQLPDHAAPKQVLMARLCSSAPRSWINAMQCHLEALNLPDISTLAANPPSTGIWHRCVNRLISCQAQLNLNEEAESKRDLDPLIRCCTKPNAPAPHWKVTHSAEMLHLTTRSNFRVRLLLGCHGLECDAARFRVRRDGGPTGNTTCKLCNSGKEDPEHFLATCNALQARRRSLLSHAPLILPDPEHDPSAFTEIILGIDWIDDLESQAFFIHYITDLKQKRSEILINQP